MPRRAFLLMPATLAAVLWSVHGRTPSPADPTEEGNGPWVDLMVLGGANTEERRINRMRKLVLPDAEWQRRLTGPDFAVARRGRTELAFTGRYARTDTPGLYRCVCCGTALFTSRDRFDSGTGWPAFTQPVAEQNIWNRSDTSLGMIRTEVLCRRCDAHLGHLFGDGPAPNGMRYCINSAALHLVPFNHPS